MKLWKELKIIPQFFLPRTIIAYLAPKLANSKKVWLKKYLIKRFIKKHKIELSRFEIQDINQYPTFNAFFIRKLKTSEMGAVRADEIGSPAECQIREFGVIEKNKMLQAKNIYFTLEQLLVNEQEYSQRLQNGSYFICYLQPNNYHRYHMPISGTLKYSIYVPAQSEFELDPVTEEAKPDLYDKNEREILFFDTEIGDMAIILIGAVYVGGIKPVWKKHILKGNKIKKEKHNLFFSQSQELGWFEFGSSIIMLFEPNRINWMSHLRITERLKVCEPIAEVIKT
jgi:phosphatidylserine decarboxylase